MRILVAGRWSNGYLDETVVGGLVRVRPTVWITLGPADGQYFVRAGGSRALAAYTREFGVRAVTRKAASRLRERDRNRRYVGIGLGVVVDADPAAVGGDRGPGAAPARDAAFGTGAAVAFVAPCHPACMERVVLDPRLLRPLARGHRSPPGPLVYRARPASAPPAVDETLIGWSPLAGATLDPAVVDRLAAWLAAEWRGPRPDDRLLGGHSPVATHDRRRPGPPAGTSRPTATLFGLGHYAKTQIVPHVRDHLDLRCVHEIDPCQIGARRTHRWAWDTSPVPRDDEPTDVVLIAGYHHTHAPLAVGALRRGAVAVVEKPVVTTAEDLDELTKLVDTGGRLFACFQRRHSPLNAWLRADLGLDRGREPMLYSAVVFEEPLPARHWYRWPASRTRLVSNGCHWIDHFLWLNDFAPVRRSTVTAARGGTFTVYVELANDAVLSLMLTSAGGSRFGLREHTELRANGVTVTIVDGARYTAEAGARILRRRRVNRLDSYPAMYRDICARIVAGDPGQDAREIRAVAELTLDLDTTAAGQEAARSAATR
ncbi:Gfo/Idh/MocA family protein [Frankia sp. AgB32]|uniref:Gfo/Idh/MocA family protein n=1 Tax=Frankia sp. AgB32 TaxID=631119 RepID=UPI00200E4658|nr:Gfo/Idh/MocA family oxidoreductase [Frankia sp. AgB32]MCK9896575.1 Gfo/Idh/MocA family oxidoreductase [Frankia sp. AgB32]